MAVLRAAWHRSYGRTRRDATSHEAQATPAAEGAHMVQLRRVRRVWNGTGDGEKIELFRSRVVAYL